MAGADKQQLSDKMMVLYRGRGTESFGSKMLSCQSIQKGFLLSFHSANQTQHVGTKM
jgi:hypothetical protein